jgi:2-amino-4-hydroxy-6-hydroxymethyldihydropteridine diphosphokinase
VSAEWVVVSLGSNLGDARAHLGAAVQGLRALQDGMGLKLAAVSPLYRTAPWQAQGPDFLNAVAVLQGPSDEQAPQRLLRALQALEAQQGRQRPYLHAPRTLDLDLILYGQREMDTEDLVLPHPRALQRAFVLQPLRDVLPELQWPGLGTGWTNLLRASSDPPPQRLHDPFWP